jgi:hypothetical protein
MKPSLMELTLTLILIISDIVQIVLPLSLEMESLKLSLIKY